MISSSAYDGLSLAASLLGVLGAALIIAAFVLIKGCRNHPSDIIFIIAIADFISDPNSIDSRSFHVIPDGCTTAMVVSSLAETAVVVWSGVWCINVTLQMLHPMRDTRVLMPLYHVYAWTLCILVLIVYLVHRPYGLVMLGRKPPACPAHRAAYRFCWQEDGTLSNYAVAIPFAIVVVQLLFAIASICVAYRRLRALAGQVAATAVLVRHVSYVFIFFVIWVTQRITLVLTLSDAYHVTVSLFWQMQAFFVALVRFSEPGVFLALLVVLRCPERLLACFSSRQMSHARMLLHASDNALHHCLLSEDDEKTSAWGVSGDVRHDLEAVDTFSSTKLGTSHHELRPTQYVPPADMLAGDL